MRQDERERRGNLTTRGCPFPSKRKSPPLLPCCFFFCYCWTAPYVCLSLALHQRCDHWQTAVFSTQTTIWSWVPEWARHQDWLTDNLKGASKQILWGYSDVQLLQKALGKTRTPYHIFISHYVRKSIHFSSKRQLSVINQPERPADVCRSCDGAPRIPKLYTMWDMPPAALSPWEGPPSPIGWDVWWAPGPVRTFRNTQNSLAAARNRHPNSPVARPAAYSKGAHLWRLDLVRWRLTLLGPSGT